MTTDSKVNGLAVTFEEGEEFMPRRRWPGETDRNLLFHSLTDCGSLGAL